MEQQNTLNDIKQTIVLTRLFKRYGVWYQLQKGLRHGLCQMILY